MASAGRWSVEAVWIDAVTPWTAVVVGGAIMACSLVSWSCTLAILASRPGRACWRVAGWLVGLSGCRASSWREGASSRTAATEGDTLRSPEPLAISLVVVACRLTIRASAWKSCFRSWGMGPGGAGSCRLVEGAVAVWAVAVWVVAVWCRTATVDAGCVAGADNFLRFG